MKTVLPSEGRTNTSPRKAARTTLGPRGMSDGIGRYTEKLPSWSAAASVTKLPSIEIVTTLPGSTLPMPSVMRPSIKSRSFLSTDDGGVTMITCDVWVALYSEVSVEGR